MFDLALRSGQEFFANWFADSSVNEVSQQWQRSSQRQPLDTL